MIEKNSNNKNIKSLEEYYKSQNKVEINQNNIIKENTNNLLVFVLTYNMKGKTPSDDDIQLLFPQDINKFDLYIISTQECLRSIGASFLIDSKEEWIKSLSKFFGENYINLINSNLGAIHLCIFCKKEKLIHFHELRSGEIKTGFLNLFSNKGAVSVSMKYLDKHILFIGCHLAAGQDENNKRNEGLFRIKTNLKMSINDDAKTKLKEQKNLHKSQLQINKLQKKDDDDNNDNNIKNNDQLLEKNNIKKKLSGSLLLKNIKKINNDDNNKDDIDIKENERYIDNMLNGLEIESEKDEKEENHINANIKPPKNVEIKMNELFENKHNNSSKSLNSIINDENKEKTMEDYDFVIISGDLNYRLNFDSNENIEEIINKKDPEILWKKDQLTEEIKKEHDLEEGIINFMPTYKYKDKLDEYDFERTPGWTDRILYKSKKKYDIMLCEYSSIQNIFLSDHKPVYAIFKINFKNKEMNKKLEIKDNNNEECIII